MPQLADSKQSKEQLTQALSFPSALHPAPPPLPSIVLRTRLLGYFVYTASEAAIEVRPPPCGEMLLGSFPEKPEALLFISQTSAIVIYQQGENAWKPVQARGKNIHTRARHSSHVSVPLIF